MVPAARWASSTIFVASRRFDVERRRCRPASRPAAPAHRRRLQLVADVGDEVGAHRVEPGPLAEVVDGRQRSAVGERHRAHLQHPLGGPNSFNRSSDQLAGDGLTASSRSTRPRAARRRGRADAPRRGCAARLPRAVGQDDAHRHRVERRRGARSSSRRRAAVGAASAAFVELSPQAVASSLRENRLTSPQVLRRRDGPPARSESSSVHLGSLRLRVVGHLAGDDVAARARRCSPRGRRCARRSGRRRPAARRPGGRCGRRRGSRRSACDELLLQRVEVGVHVVERGGLGGVVLLNASMAAANSCCGLLAHLCDDAAQLRVEVVAVDAPRRLADVAARSAAALDLGDHLQQREHLAQVAGDRRLQREDLDAVLLELDARASISASPRISSRRPRGRRRAGPPWPAGSNSTTGAARQRQLVAGSSRSWWNSCGARPSAEPSCDVVLGPLVARVGEDLLGVGRTRRARRCGGRSRGSPRW